MEQNASNEKNTAQKQVANVMFLIILTLISGLVLYLILSDAGQRTSDNSRESKQCLKEPTVDLTSQSDSVDSETLLQDKQFDP